MSEPDPRNAANAQMMIHVNERDEALGALPRDACHAGDGILHRAFSIFILNSANQVLLQRRSASKQLWPLFWSNACCSHPRPGEECAEAAHRRLTEELGITAELTFLYKFRYHAPFLDVGSERELCWVWIGRSDARITAPPDEIAEHRFVAPAALDQEIADAPARFTPWLRLEWRTLRTEHAHLWH